MRASYKLYHSDEYGDSDDTNDDDDIDVDHDDGDLNNDEYDDDVDDIDRILTSFKDMQTMNVEQIRERVSMNCDRRI